MSHHTPPVSQEEWDRGLPDFIEENSAFKHDVFFAALLIAGLVAGAYVVIHF